MGDFDALYEQHLPAVFRYALSCVGRREIAEEIAAEAFLAFYRNLERIDAAQLPGWLLTVVKNRAVDYWRRVQLEQRKAVETQTAANGPQAQVAADEEGLDAWLVEHCTDLKPVHRACLLLRFVQGMTRAEIARKLGLSENQVKGALQYALELLRKAFPESLGPEG
jgi:RNA polymerase sigma-70 factor (ECF subfamily)